MDRHPSPKQKRTNAGLSGLSSQGVERIFMDLLNLEYSVRMDGWVGTRRSNWSRLVDELRRTIGGKGGAEFQYREASEKIDVVGTVGSGFSVMEHAARRKRGMEKAHDHDHAAPKAKHAQPASAG